VNFLCHNCASTLLECIYSGMKISLVKIGKNHV